MWSCDKYTTFFVCVIHANKGVKEAMCKSSWSFIREVIIAYSLNLNLSNQNWNRLYSYWAQKSLEYSILLILNHKSFYTCIYSMRRRIEFGRRRRRALVHRWNMRFFSFPLLLALLIQTFWNFANVKLLTAACL